MYLQVLNIVIIARASIYDTISVYSVFEQLEIYTHDCTIFKMLLLKKVYLS